MARASEHESARAQGWERKAGGARRVETDTDRETRTRTARLVRTANGWRGAHRPPDTRWESEKAGRRAERARPAMTRIRSKKAKELFFLADTFARRMDRRHKQAQQMPLPSARRAEDLC